MRRNGSRGRGRPAPLAADRRAPAPDLGQPPAGRQASQVPADAQGVDEPARAPTTPQPFIGIDDSEHERLARSYRRAALRRPRSAS